MAGVLKEGNEASAVALGGHQGTEDPKAAAEGIVGVAEGIATGIPGDHNEVLHLSRSLELAEAGIEVPATAFVKDG
jgi:hypothetical protein